MEEVGALSATEGSEIRFSIDEYRGHRYGSIRKYLKSDTFNGPTRSGITLSPPMISGILAALEKLSVETKGVKEKELGRYAKRAGLVVVVRISSYRDTLGIDLSEWQDDSSHKGWTKRGVRLPYKKLGEIKTFLTRMIEIMPDIA